MQLYSKRYEAEFYVEIEVEKSIVDSYIRYAWNDTSGYEATDAEIEWLNSEFTDEIQQYAWANGSVNHN